MEIKRRLAAPGPGPAGLAWDGKTIWNADFQDGHLYRLTPESGEVTESILCPGVSGGLTWDGRYLWQTVLDEGWLRAIDPANHDFDRTLVLADAERPTGLTWDGRYLWVVSQQRGLLLAIDPETEAVARTIQAPVAAGGLAYRNGTLWLAAPEQMGFNPATQTFEWTSAERSFWLLQLEPDGGRELARFRLGFLPLGLAWAGDELWMSNAGEGALYVGLGIGDQGSVANP